jgi:hypothetical protein
MVLTIKFNTLYSTYTYKGMTVYGLFVKIRYRRPSTARSPGYTAISHLRLVRRPSMIATPLYV